MKLSTRTTCLSLAISTLFAIACGGATESSQHADEHDSQGDASKVDSSTASGSSISLPGVHVMVDEQDAGPDARFQVDGALFPDTSTLDVATFDAGAPDPLAFADQISGVYCARFGSCCVGLGLSSTFNDSMCTGSLGDYPYGLFGIPTFFKSKLGGGHITFDADAAAECLGLMSTFSCGQFGSADWIELNRKCLSAMKGNIPTGETGCTSSVECEQPARCEIAEGNTTGTCVAYLDVGAACTGDFQCGDALTGSTRYCTTIESFPAAASGVCADQRADGEECHGMPQECASQLCEVDGSSSTGFRCATQASFVTEPMCQMYK